jgi:hypothetical protein
MTKFLVLAITVGLGIVLARQLLPDIQRYIRMETM